MVRRGRQAANSILKQAADWNNCCSSLCTKPYRSVSVILALKWQALLLRRTDISFCCCLKKTMGSEIPHYGVTSGCWIFFFYFFFFCWWHFCFSSGHAWQMSHRLEAMWSMPHTVGCSRASVKAVRSPCTEEFYCSKLCSDLSVLTI